MNEDKTSASTPSLADEVQKSFLNQFAQNQNHHQLLFIQFLSSLIIVLVAFAFVYTNTSGIENKEKGLVNLSQEQSSTKILDSNAVQSKVLYADKFQSKKNESGDILTYGVIHLVSIYLFAEVVLLILAIVLLNMGYSFRRDQVIINKIRAEAMGKPFYVKIFGSFFTGENKGILNFLPNFYSILFCGIFLIQFVIYLLIVQYLNQAPQEEIFIPKFLSFDITFYQTKITLAFPIVITTVFYCLYFLKYNRKVNYRDYLGRVSILEITKRSLLMKMAIVSTFLFIMFLLGYFFYDSLSYLAVSYIMVANGIICFLAYFLVLAEQTKSPGEIKFSDNKIMATSLIHGLIYLLCLIHLLYICTNNIILRTHTVQNLPLQTGVNFGLFILFLLLGLIVKKYHGSKTFRIVLLRQLGILTNLFLFQSLTFFLMLKTNMKWPDTIFALILSTAILFWSASRLSKFFTMYLKK